MQGKLTAIIAGTMLAITGATLPASALPRPKFEVPNPIHLIEPIKKLPEVWHWVKERKNDLDRMNERQQRQRQQPGQYPQQYPHSRY